MKNKFNIPVILIDMVNLNNRYLLLIGRNSFIQKYIFSSGFVSYSRFLGETEGFHIRFGIYLSINPKK